MFEVGEIRLFLKSNMPEFIYPAGGASVPVLKSEWRRWTGGYWEPVNALVQLPEQVK